MNWESEKNTREDVLPMAPVALEMRLDRIDGRLDQMRPGDHVRTSSGEVKRAFGHAPPVVDTMLVATAIEHDLYLVTRNVKNTRPSAAIVFDPLDDDPAKFPPSHRGDRAR